jgi:hypothetical protein
MADDGWCVRHQRRHVGRARYWAEHPTDDRVRQAWERGPAPLSVIAVEAVRSLTRLAASAGAQVAAPIAAARWAICQGCPQLHGTTCQACGCYMPRKSRFLAMRCPLGLWAE